MRVPVIAAHVQAHRDHPAVLAWYTGEEPKILMQGDRLVEHYNACVANDADRPVLFVDNKDADPRPTYLRALDIFGAESKPLYDDTSGLEQCTERAAAAVSQLPSRGMWHVPQSFAWSALGNNHIGRFPTLEEFRNMTWQFLHHKGTGLIYWDLDYMHKDADLSFDESMAIASEVGQEVIDLVPVLMSIDDCPEISTPTDLWWSSMTKAHDDKGNLFAANITRQDETAVFTVPAAVTVSVLGEGRSLPVEPDGSVSDSFAELAVHNYQIELVNFDNLQRLTTEYYSQVDASPRTAVGLLSRWRDADVAKRATPARQMSTAYVDRIREDTDRLTQDRANTLRRLAMSLADAM